MLLPIADPDLLEFSESLLSRVSDYVFNVPPFDRPCLHFSPTHDEFQFVFPFLHHSSLLYTPLNRSEVQKLKDILTRSISVELTDNELQTVRIRNSFRAIVNQRPRSAHFCYSSTGERHWRNSRESNQIDDPVQSDGCDGRDSGIAKIGPKSGLSRDDSPIPNLVANPTSR